MIGSFGGNDKFDSTAPGDPTEGRELYEFTWPGKKASLIEAGTPTNKVLRPCIEESKNFDTTQNLYIEGENLDVLKILYKSYAGKVKMIYIDPPYNTGNDFIYNDKFRISEDEAEQQYKFIDEEGNRNFSARNYSINKRPNPRFHSDWCSMIYSRLRLACDLLTDDGVIFISIDDNEQANLRKICDEIFGESNFIGNILWNSTKSITNTALISSNHTHNLVYCRNIDYFTAHRAEFRLPEDGEGFANPDNDPRGVWKADPFQVGGWRPNQQYEIVNPITGKKYKPNPGCSWKNDYKHFQELLQDNRIVFGTSGESGPQRKRFLYEATERGRVTKTWWDDVDTTTNATQQLKKLFDGKSLFPNPKPVDLVTRFMQLATKSDSLVLDFFSGSATTAHAVMALNAADGGKRKFIMVNLPEDCKPDSEAYKAGYRTICDIGKERIRRAGQKLCDESPLTTSELDTGFRVFKLASKNFCDVYFKPEEYTQDMLDSLVYNIKSDRTGLDLLFGYAAELGLPLSLSYREEQVEGFVVHVYGDNEIAACFDESLNAEIVTNIAKRKPVHTVFREWGFKDMNARINLEQIIKAYAPDTKLLIL